MGWTKKFIEELRQRGITLREMLPLCPGTEQSLLWSLIESE